MHQSLHSKLCAINRIISWKFRESVKFIFLSSAPQFDLHCSKTKQWEDSWPSSRLKLWWHTWGSNGMETSQSTTELCCLWWFTPHWEFPWLFKDCYPIFLFLFFLHMSYYLLIYNVVYINISFIIFFTHEKKTWRKRLWPPPSFWIS